MTSRPSRIGSISVVGRVCLCLLIVTFCHIKSQAEKTQDDDRQIEPEAPRFSWKNHQEDHSIYSGRSLMSAKSIESKARDKANDNTLYEDEHGALETVDYAEKEWQLMFRNLDIMFDGIEGSDIVKQFVTQTDIFNNVVRQLNPDCARDILHSRDSFRKHKMWALRMVDSFGKIPSGVTYGRFASQGDFEECIGISVDETIHRKVANGSNNFVANKYKFNGKYCLLDFRLPLPERPRDRALSIHEPVLNLSDTKIGKMFPVLVNYSGYASAFYEIGYMHAFCFPNSCQGNEIARALSNSLEGMHILVNSTVDCQEAAAQPIRTSQIISILLLSVIFLNAGYASYLHCTKEFKGSSQTNIAGQHRDEPNAKPDQLANKQTQSTRCAFYVSCFSIQNNFYKLTKPDPKGLTFVHYTRIVAMAFTIITHTAAMGTLQAISKPADSSNSEAMFRDFLPQMLANAFTSIQIFFFMAGFMLVLSTYPAIKRDKGHLSLVEYATKRAIRLLPGILAAILVNFLWPLFVNGPMVNYFAKAIMEPCETNWWRTMMFISNFDHVEKMCLRHSYFSASDYQLHLVSFPLLIMLYKQPNVALIIAAFLAVTGFVIQVIMILTKILIPFMVVDYIDKEAFFNVVHYFHHPVWNHMSAFFYGFIIGYLVVRQVRFNLSRRTIKYTWNILMPLGLAAIFAPYFWNHYKRPVQRWQMVIYVVVDRVIVLTACAWLSYGTMVLARKPRVSRAKSNLQQPVLNLPEIVTLGPNGDTGAKLDKSSTECMSNQTLENTETIMQKVPDASVATRSQLGPRSMSSMSRLDALGQTNPTEKTPTTTMLRASSLDLDSGRAKRTQRPTGPISNINTLCLVLSRLTFQLYLFNMIVLCIDVNHSKYNWYFSYYFVFVKSFAVYIASTAMSIISYVVLEVPCLTLYIAWVKSRAAARAKQRATFQQSSEKGGPNFGEPQIAPTKINVSYSTGQLAKLSGSIVRPNPGSESLSLQPDWKTCDLTRNTLSLSPNDLKNQFQLPHDEPAKDQQTKM